MRKNVSRKKVFYFSDRLKRQLSRIPDYPLTIIEAPSGFGKTTAVREYLKENLPSGAREYWYTCLGEPACAAWKGICGLLANADAAIASDLSGLDIPGMDTLTHIRAVLAELDCRDETYLVIDNYHLMDCKIPHELLSVFSMHGSPNLHFIFITQQLGTRFNYIIHSADIHIIGAAVFFFDRQGISALFRMEGIRLTDDELESVFMSTDGWVSALRLQIMNYEQTGTFNYSADIEQLVESAVWDRLAPEEKDFLLAVSVMDSFTAHQAAVMAGTEVLPESVGRLLRTNDFIKYYPDKGIYTLHSILQDYLRSRFEYHLPEELKKRILRLAGLACAASGEYCAAAGFFYRTGDFDAVLSLPFTHPYLDRQKEFLPLGIPLAILDECPEETMRIYPNAMLLFGFRMLTDTQCETYKKICRVLEGVIADKAALPGEELRQIEGEYIFLRSFDCFNDVHSMTEGQQRAWSVLGRPAKMLPMDFTFASGSASLLSIYWKKAGGLEDMLEAVDKASPNHLRLTGGHGAGADSALRAEAMLQRGEDDEAEILCHKALYDARSHRQSGICICTELTLARIAILRGDAEGYFSAYNAIKGYAKDGASVYIQRMADAGLATLSLALDSPEDVAGWITDTEQIRQSQDDRAAAPAQVFYSRLLLLEKRYKELFGIFQSVLHTAESMDYMLPQVCHHIYIASAKRDSGSGQEAQEYLKLALSLALPDKIYLPFAQEECMEVFLSETFIGLPERGGPAHAAVASIPLAGDVRAGCEELSCLRELCRRQQKGAGVIKKAIWHSKSPLTPREREIARLARDRLSAREIADRLYIAETTVRATLRNIYSKLDVHSKAELNSKEF